jgi:hypothetical protein
MLASLSAVAVLAHPQISTMKVPHPWSMLPAIAISGGLLLGIGAWLGGVWLMAIESQRFLAIGMWEAGRDFGLSFSEKVPRDFRARFGSYQVFREGYWHRVRNMLEGRIEGYGVIVCHVTCCRYGTNRAQARTFALLSNSEQGSLNIAARSDACQSDVDDCYIECRGRNLAVWRDLWCLGQMRTLIVRGQSEVVRQSVHQLLAEAFVILRSPYDVLNASQSDLPQDRR